MTIPLRFLFKYHNSYLYRDTLSYRLQNFCTAQLYAGSAFTNHNHKQLDFKFQALAHA